MTHLLQPWTDNLIDAVLRRMTDEELAWPIPWTVAQWEQHQHRLKAKPAPITGSIPGTE